MSQHTAMVAMFVLPTAAVLLSLGAMWLGFDADDSVFSTADDE